MHRNVLKRNTRPLKSFLSHGNNAHRHTDTQLFDDVLSVGTFKQHLAKLDKYKNKVEKRMSVKYFY